MSRFLVFLTLFFFNPSVFAARTIVVDKEGGDFTTVAEASEAAKEGDTVFIRSHSDSLDRPEAFKKGIKYVSDGSVPQSVTLKNQDGISLSGFLFRSLKVEASKAITIEKCQVEGGAISIRRSEGISVQNCSFLNPNPQAAQARLQTDDSKKITITGNLIHAAYRGLMLVDTDAIVTKNTIVNARYTGPKLNPDDLADAHEALTSSEGILIQCGVSGLEAWEKKKAFPAEIAENIIAFNDRGIIVDRCRKGNDTLKVHHNLFHANGEQNYVAVVKKYKEMSFSYVLENILAKKRMEDTGNKFLDPLLADDYSLKGESPALRMGMGKDKGAIGAPQEVTKVGIKK